LTPGAAVTAQTPPLSRIASIDGPADLIRVDGRFLYVVADRMLRIIDIANPSAPKPAGEFTFAEHIRSFTVSGSHVYALADFHGLRVVDVSSPASPVLRGSLQLKGGYFNIVPFETNILLASSVLSGLQIIDVSDEATPFLLASYSTDGYVQSISVSPPLAYVIEEPAGLYVFDLSNPRLPAVAALLELNVPRQPRTAALTNVLVAISEAVAGRSPKIAVLQDSTSGFLLVYDVSNPAALVKMGSVSVAAGSEAIAVRGSFAYIASGKEGLHVVDFSKPSEPVNTGSIKTVHPAHDVTVSESHVFVATGAGGVVVFGRTQ